jgi:hypothetical protein
MILGYHNKSTVGFQKTLLNYEVCLLYNIPATDKCWRAETYELYNGLYYLSNITITVNVYY